VLFRKILKIPPKQKNTRGNDLPGKPSTQNPKIKKAVQEDSLIKMILSGIQVIYPTS
jgi:hypothetical protein